jgi:hypothetical protein
MKQNPLSKIIHDRAKRCCPDAPFVLLRTLNCEDEEVAAQRVGGVPTSDLRYAIPELQQRQDLLRFWQGRHGLAKRGQIALIYHGCSGVHPARGRRCRRCAPILELFQSVVVQVV